MSHNKFNIAMLTSFGSPAWQASEDRLHGGDWWNGRFFVELAQRLEAAKFDFLFFEDTSTVAFQAGGTMDNDLRFSTYTPKHDPLSLLPLLAGATKHIGLVATASTTFYPPYILARQLATVDHLSGGRVGWNVVTSAESTAAQNFNMDDLPNHSTRYEIADEFLDVAKKLWTSWEPDALVRDLRNNTHVDPTKVREVNHKGKHFQVRGPLNVMRSPQGQPVIVQAGSSERGRDFAAKHAEVVFAPAEGVEAMKAFRDDVRERARKQGRSPDDVKVMFAAPLQFRPDDQPPGTPMQMTDAQVDYAMAFFSATFNMDLSQFDRDKPLPPDVEPSGHTGMFMELKHLCESGMTLKEAIVAMQTGGAESWYGSPEELAERIIEVMDVVGGDGLMIVHWTRLTKAYLDNLTLRLVPLLQKAGVMRTEYRGNTLRESLKLI